jgi:hypothetical protein
MDGVGGDFEYNGRPPPLDGGLCVAVVWDRIVAVMVPVLFVDVESEGPKESLKPLLVSVDRCRIKTEIVGVWRVQRDQYASRGRARCVTLGLISVKEGNKDCRSLDEANRTYRADYSLVQLCAR